MGSALGGSGAVEVRGSGGFRRPGDVVSGGEAVGHLGGIVIGGEPMAAGPEMRGDHGVIIAGCCALVINATCVR